MIRQSITNKNPHCVFLWVRNARRCFCVPNILPHKNTAHLTAPLLRTGFSGCMIKASRKKGAFQGTLRQGLRCPRKSCMAAFVNRRHVVFLPVCVKQRYSDIWSLFLRKGHFVHIRHVLHTKTFLSEENSMKRTFVTVMPNHIGAFLKASRCFSDLGVNITRVSYNKAVDSHCLFIDARGLQGAACKSPNSFGKNRLPAKRL